MELFDFSDGFFCRPDLLGDLIDHPGEVTL